MRLANLDWQRTVVAAAAVVAFSFLVAGAQTPAPAGQAVPNFSKLPKLWHSDATKHDFRVQVTNDLFRAEWMNVPPADAKQGAYIRTECRRVGAKWVGTSQINMPVAISPTGKDTKMCMLKTRFEVDSITPEKISGHSESLHGFDVNTCTVLETKMVEFSWVPKK